LLIVFVVFMIDNVMSAKRSMITSSEEVIENLAQTDMTEIREDATSNEVEVQDITAKVTNKLPKKDIVLNIIKFVAGAAAIVYGADMLVDNGSILASMMGISERIISVTLIAIGTSLPELVTTITAVVKRQSSLSVGNIIGANIIDLTLIMPLCSIISGQALPIVKQAAFIDLPVSLLVCMIALVPMLCSSKFKRWQGIALMVVYVAFLIVTCTVVIV
jgi:cation:H+ antiporter